MGLFFGILNYEIGVLFKAEEYYEEDIDYDSHVYQFFNQFVRAFGRATSTHLSSTHFQYNATTIIAVLGKGARI